MLSTARAALLATAAVTFSVMPAPVAHAVEGVTDVALVLADKVGQDGNPGLYRYPTPTGSSTTLVSESPTTYRSGLSTSRDGSRALYGEFVYNADDDLVRSRIVVRDVGGRLVRILEDLASSTARVVGNGALSPDGRNAAWTIYDYSTQTTQYSIHRAAVASGASVTVPGSNGFGVGTYLSSTVLAVGDATSEKQMPVTGGTPRAIVGDHEPSYDYTVSPDGTHIAWAFVTSPSSSEVVTTQIQVAPLSFSSGVASFGSPVTIATGQLNRHPAFSRDGTKVYFLKDDADLHNDSTGVPGPGDVWVAPADGSAPASNTGATAADERALAIGAMDGAAPGPVSVSPITLAGTSVTLRWTPPSAADLSGVTVLRTDTSSGATKPYFVSMPLTSLVQTGLTLGRTYSYTFRAVDRSGNSSAAVNRSLTALAAPHFVIADPTSTGTAHAPFVVSYGGANPSGTGRYTVRAAAVGSTSYLPWLTGVSAKSATYGSPAAAGKAATTSVAGTTYTFDAVTSDAFGNSTAKTYGRTVVPLDQTAATYSGGSTVSGSDRWLGSVRILGADQRARIVFTHTGSGNRFRIIGERCPRCSAFQVYDRDGARLLATVDSYAASRQPRQVLYSGFVQADTEELVIRNLGTAGRTNLILDGFALRR